jgi:multidrug efflux pump subunit AcrB
MKLSHFYIDHPRFAAVINIFIMVFGLAAASFLPVAQYPNIVPPTVQIQTVYPGSSAETIARTVATPLEQAINGVENMDYMTSQSTSNGQLTITVIFKIGTNIDTTLMLTHNRVQDTLSRLPQEVQLQGVQIKKTIPALLLGVHPYSPDGSRDAEYISNYMILHVRDEISRLPGVADLWVLGERQYAMRIWIDPDKAAANDISASDILSALRAQNAQVSAGALNQPPVFNSAGGAYQINVKVLGRLTTPEQFGDIIVKSDAQGRVTRIRDIGRVELGSVDYGSVACADKHASAPFWVIATPGADVVKVEHEVWDKMAELKKSFPVGIDYINIYDPTTFVSQSIHEVIVTIGIAIILVVGVVYVFLQSWRATIIPVIAIPVSLVGAFSILAALGISINNLSLFGLVLAVGIVVDDAIVVVENVERNMAIGMLPREAAYHTMTEVSGALIAIALTLCAVFVPTAFISGISGLFFTQFAATIAASTVISCFVSLTLSPALSAVLLKPHDVHAEPRGISRILRAAFGRFNAAFEWMSSKYGNMTSRVVRATAIILVFYVGLISLTGFQFARMPTGFIPQQDIGYLAAVVELPPGSSLQRTDAVVRQVNDIILQTPGVEHTSPVAGFDVTTNTNQPNVGTIFLGMPSLYGHHIPGVNAASVLTSVRQRLAVVKDAFVLVINPPPVQGLGAAGGFKLMVEDRNNLGPQALADATNALVAAANKDRAFGGVFTLYNAGSPTLYGHRPPRDREGRADADRCVLHPSAVSRLAVRERLQLSGPHVPGPGPGRGIVPAEPGRHRAAQGPQQQRRDGADRFGRQFHGPDRALPRATLQPLSRRRCVGLRRAGRLVGHRDGTHGEARQAGAVRRLHLRMDRAVPSAGAAGHTNPRDLCSLGRLRVPRAGGAIRELEAAAGDRADRADVSAGLGHWPRLPGDADRHPRPDRLRRAGRLGREERDPDRGIRAAAADSGRRRTRGGRDGGRPDPAPPDPDDRLRLHPRRLPARGGDRGGLGDAPIARHGRVLRNVRSHDLRPAVHASVLHLRPQARLQEYDSAPPTLERSYATCRCRRVSPGFDLNRFPRRSPKAAASEGPQRHEGR